MLYYALTLHCLYFASGIHKHGELLIKHANCSVQQSTSTCIGKAKRQQLISLDIGFVRLGSYVYMIIASPRTILWGDSERESLRAGVFLCEIVCLVVS